MSHRVTPDALALADQHYGHWKCVVRSVFWLPEEPMVHGDRRYLLLLLHLRVDFAMTQ